MRLGIEIKIDVTKIDKSKLYKGDKGTYLSLTTFINTNEADKYGNHGTAFQSITKEEKEGGVKPTILGNSKIFFKKDSFESRAQNDNANHDNNGDDDIPF